MLFRLKKVRLEVSRGVIFFIVFIMLGVQRIHLHLKLIISLLGIKQRKMRHALFPALAPHRGTLVVFVVHHIEVGVEFVVTVTRFGGLASFGK